MLPEIVTEAAERYGERAAIVAADGWALTYAQLHQASDEAAAGLAERGVGEGDVVALCLPSTPDYLVAYVAAAKVGAVTAGVNPRLTTVERDACLAVAHPTLTLATAELLPGREAGKVLEVEVGSEPDSVLRRLRRQGRTVPALDDDPDRAVAIVFTSGTTGHPKGAVYRNRQLAAIEQADTGGASTWGTGGDNLAATQFAHVGTMTKTVWQLRSGATMHLLDRWRPGDALAALARLEAKVVAGVPPQVALLLGHPSVRDHGWSHVQAIVAGGGPATPALVAEAQEVFGAPMSVRYSSTESGGVGCGTEFGAPPEEAFETVGRPRGPVELSIRDVESGQPVTDGDVGEVCLRSPCATDGYWNDPTQTEALFWASDDGSTLRWLRMGDLGRIVADGPAAGCLQLVGRAKEMFVRGGYNVYPMETEAVLATHPDVAEVALVPRPDDVMGEIGVAVVVASDPDAPPTLDGLRDWGAQRLSHHKLPEDLVVVDALPRTAMEKLDRRALAARVA